MLTKLSLGWLQSISITTRKGFGESSGRLGLKTREGGGVRWMKRSHRRRLRLRWKETFKI
jgi:hypothetical protein